MRRNTFATTSNYKLIDNDCTPFRLQALKRQCAQKLSSQIIPCDRSFKTNKRFVTMS